MRNLVWFGLAFGIGGALSAGCEAAFGQCPIQPPMREDNNGRRLLWLECSEITVTTKQGNKFTLLDSEGLEVYVVVDPLPEIGGMIGD